MLLHKCIFGKSIKFNKHNFFGQNIKKIAEVKISDS